MKTTCPRCGVPLQNLRQGQVLSYSCPDCGGRAVTLPALRKQADGGAINVLWRHAQQAKIGKGPGCPTCMNAMTTIHLSGPELVEAGAPGATPDSEPLALDVCKPCTLVWFDAGEQEQLPAADSSPVAADRADTQRAAATATADMMIAQAKMQSAPLTSRTKRLDIAADVADWVGGLLG